MPCCAPSRIDWFAPCNDFSIEPERVLISEALGGDEFVVVLRRAAAREAALEIARRCAEAFKLAITHDALEVYSSPNIGRRGLSGRRRAM